MKFISTNTTDVPITGIFNTPIGVYTLTDTDYSSELVTSLGVIATSGIAVTQPTDTTKGAVTVNVTVPAGAKGGLCTLHLYSGVPAQRVGSLQWQVLDSAINGDYSTDSTTSIPII